LRPFIAARVKGIDFFVGRVCLFAAIANFICRVLSQCIAGPSAPKLVDESFTFAARMDYEVSPTPSFWDNFPLHRRLPSIFCAKYLH